MKRDIDRLILSSLNNCNLFYRCHPRSNLSANRKQLTPSFEFSLVSGRCPPQPTPSDATNPHVRQQHFNSSNESHWGMRFRILQRHAFGDCRSRPTEYFRKIVLMRHILLKLPYHSHKYHQCSRGTMGKEEISPFLIRKSICDFCQMSSSKSQSSPYSRANFFSRHSHQ